MFVSGCVGVSRQGVDGGGSETYTVPNIAAGLRYTCVIVLTICRVQLVEGLLISQRETSL